MGLKKNARFTVDTPTYSGAFFIIPTVFYVVNNLGMFLLLENLKLKNIL